MKCECGNEYEGNYCPLCGKETAAMGKSAASRENGNETKGLSEESKDVLKGAVILYLNTRLKFMFLGAFLVALMALLSGKILSGIMFVVCGVLLMPQMLKKYSGKQLALLLGAVAICIFLGAITWGA